MFDSVYDYADFVQQHLEDTKNGVLLQGQPLKTRIIPIYLSEDDPRRIPEDIAAEMEDMDMDLLANRKYLWLPHPCLYRCAETNGEWCPDDSVQLIAFDSRNFSIEVINLDEEELRLCHYIVTSRKDAEDPAAQEFEYEVSGDEVTVTGVRYYCERLHIPAFLSGKPVTRVIIPFQRELIRLWELVLPDSVRYFDFYWEYTDLEVIRMPETTVLANAPDTIDALPWFESQPEGPVYLNGYYCGTKGMDDVKELIIREDTVGTIRSADCDRRWEAITFPSSFRYMGRYSFHASSKCKLTIPEECTAVKEYFEQNCMLRLDFEEE